MIGEIVLVNKSKLYPDPTSWTPIISALRIQLERDIGPCWGIEPPWVSLSLHDEPFDGLTEAAIITIIDTPDEPGALGYHTRDAQGRILGRVFLEPTLFSQGSMVVGADSVSVTLSHEILEILGNPLVDTWVDNDRDGYQYCKERCDPVERDGGYIIEGVAVSNFVTDAWFDSSSKHKTHFDFLNLLKKPFSLSPGGYLIRRKPGQKEEFLFANGYPLCKKDLKTRWGRLSNANLDRKENSKFEKFENSKIDHDLRTK